MNERRELVRAFASLAGIAALLILLWILVAYGFGSRMDWPEVKPGTPPAVVAPRAGVQSEPPRDPQRYENIWSISLFNARRSPDSLNIAPAPVKIVPSMSGYMLTGIVVNQQLKIAMMKGSAGEMLNVKEGDLLPNGWRLEHISERQVELVYEESRHTLKISAPRLPMTFPRS